MGYPAPIVPDWLEPWLAPALLVGLFAWLRADINTLRTELRADINTLRTELRADINTLRTELSNRIEGLAATIADIDRRVARLEGMFSAGSAGRVQPHQPQAEAEHETNFELEPTRQIRRRVDIEDE